jgi:L-amino acid N-acyltransferase YncA
VSIRPAVASDAAAVRDIYAPFVEHTAVSFEVDVPGVEDFAKRIEATPTWLVHETDGAVDGYAYAGPWRGRCAYDWAVELTVYLADGARGRGIGRQLVEAVADAERARGIVQAFAQIALPNDASEGLFRATGFEHVGTMRRVGYKLGAWHDVSIWQRELVEPPVPPPRPV